MTDSKETIIKTLEEEFEMRVIPGRDIRYFNVDFDTLAQRFGPGNCHSGLKVLRHFRNFLRAPIIIDKYGSDHQKRVEYTSAITDNMPREYGSFLNANKLRLNSIFGINQFLNWVQENSQTMGEAKVTSEIEQAFQKINTLYQERSWNQLSNYTSLQLLIIEVYESVVTEVLNNYLGEQTKF